MELCSDVLCFDTDELIVVIIGGNGLPFRCIVKSMVKQEADGSLHGTTEVMVGSTMADDFVAHAVFLCGEGVGGSRCCFHFGNGRCVRIKFFVTQV